MRTLLIALAWSLSWSGCSAVYGPFSADNPANCRHHLELCATGELCDTATGRCVPATLDAAMPVDPVFSTQIGCTASELIAALAAANTRTDTRVLLAPGCVYTLTAPDNYWYGPNGLPPISSHVELVGNGAIIERSSMMSTPYFRLLYVAGPPTPAMLLPAGALVLRDLTLRGGFALGGSAGAGGGGSSSHCGGGGGLGAGGAIFSQGDLTLVGVTVMTNTAQGGVGVGGNGVDVSGGGGGGGMGGNGVDAAMASYGGGGGGFGSSASGGNGGGFQLGTEGGKSDTTGGSGSGNAPGSDSIGTSAGPGGGTLGLGGSTQHDGGDGGNSLAGGAGGGGGAGFGGHGGKGYTNGTNQGGGGGGFSGGGGGGVNGSGGGGGVGGGGGGGHAPGSFGGQGGFGGGGGGGGCGNATGTARGGQGGFGGGGGGGLLGGSADNAPSAYGGGNGDYGGGGGLGAGGAIFIHAGQLTVINSTLSGNSAYGGSTTGSTGTVPGSSGTALGGAVFNLNGTVTLINTTVAGNVLAPLGSGSPALMPCGGAVYNLALGRNQPIAKLTLQNSILAGSTGGVDLCNAQPAGTATVDASQLNLIFSDKNGAGTLDDSGAIKSADPKLGPLADNGGPTPTRALAADSPALHAGNASLCAQAPVGGVDQRGLRRPPDRCSLGAFDPDGTTPPPPDLSAPTGHVDLGASLLAPRGPGCQLGPGAAAPPPYAPALALLLAVRRRRRPSPKSFPTVTSASVLDGPCQD